MDNLNTHSIGSLYEAFGPEKAFALAQRLEIHHTPKHGSWLNIAEIELSALTRQCLDRRIDDLEVLNAELTAWQAEPTPTSAKSSGSSPPATPASNSDTYTPNVSGDALLVNFGDDANPAALLDDIVLPGAIANYTNFNDPGVPRTFRTADPYRIFIRKDGITWQGSTRSFSPEFREEAARMVVETSRPIADVARELGVNETSLGNWVRAYREKHAGDEPPLQLSERARLRELEREVRELRMKADFLSKAAAYFAAEHR